MADDFVSDWDRDILATYDAVAEEYASHFADELASKPFDRSLLEKFAQLIPEDGRVCDMGCGPGHVSRFLSERGVEVVGVDVSPAMVQVAARLNPEIVFERGNMLRTRFNENTFAGIVAFYSIIHIERSRLPQALSELFRVVAPGGRFLVAFHAGEGEVHPEEFLGQKVCFHATFFGIDEMEAKIATTGFLIEETMHRDPYEFEYPSQRAYVLARKP